MSKMFYKFLNLFKLDKKKVDNYTYNKLLNLLIETPNIEVEEDSISEKLLIKNIVMLRDKRAQDIMVPRVDINAVEVNLSTSEILKLINLSGFSRIPIYKDKLDNIVGFLHVKDLFSVMRKKDEINLKSLTRPILFISPYVKLLDLLYELKRKRTHMAIVVDEFGGVDGLITMEDIVEEIVGEIVDEYDKDPEVMMEVSHKEKKIIADGRLELYQLESEIGNFLNDEEKEESNTIGGLIVSLSGYIPSKNEIIEHNSGIEFRVLASDSMRINKVSINYAKYLDKE